MDAQKITLNGASIQPSTIGNIYPDEVYQTITDTEVIVETLLIPANFINGFQTSSPFIGFNAKLNEESYSGLTLRVYVNIVPTIGGELITEQEYPSQFMVIGGGISLNSQLLSQNVDVNVYNIIYNKNQVLVYGGGNTMDSNSVYTFDNFDVSIDQYVIVTAQKSNTPIGLYTQVITVSSIGGNFVQLA